MDFVEGKLEIKDGSSWISLESGSMIPNGKVIRLNAGTVVELTNNGNKFSLTRPGVYSIDSILKANSRNSRAESIILRTIKKLFQHKAAGGSDILGVRGAEVEDDGFSWSNDEYTDQMEEGKNNLSSGMYQEAVSNFKDAVDSSFDDAEGNEALFYLSYAKTLQGDTAEALSVIEEYTPDPETAYYEQGILLKANLLLENFKPEEAVEWIDTYISDTEDVNQSMLLLEGLAFLQMDKEEDAERIFTDLSKNSSDREAAETAKEYLESIN